MAASHKPGTTAAQRRASAVADAREMLLAMGITPPADDDPSGDALELLNAQTRDAKRVITIHEFCRIYGVSESRYYRNKKRGAGPRETKIMGVLRVSVDDAETWLKAQPVEQQTAAKLAKLVDVVEVVQAGGKRAVASKAKPGERVVGRRVAGSLFVAPVPIKKAKTKPPGEIEP